MCVQTLLGYYIPTTCDIGAQPCRGGGDVFVLVVATYTLYYYILWFFGPIYPSKFFYAIRCYVLIVTGKRTLDPRLAAISATENQPDSPTSKIALSISSRSPTPGQTMGPKTPSVYVNTL